MTGAPRAAYTLRLAIEPSLQRPSAVRRIRFAPGGTSGSVVGIAAQGVHERYVFAARKGQTAHVRITSRSGDVNWAMVGPSGQPLKRLTSEARNSTITLPATGDYRISIGAPRAGLRYRLTLQIPA